MGTLSAVDDIALRVVPTITNTTHPDAIDLTDVAACTGDYLCDCIVCNLDRARRVKNGIRTIRPPWVPTRRAA